MAPKANSENEFIDAAKQRWPGYQITGNGSLAVVYHCTHRVELVTTPIEASVIANERCGPNCSHIRNPEGGWHKVERINPPRPRAAIVIRDWED